jgi:hypothetical protein
MAATVVAPKTTSTAKTANVLTAHMCTKKMPAYQASRVFAFSPSSRETAFATTKITMRAATGTTAIAVGSLATPTNTKYAKIVNAWTVLTSLKKTSAPAMSSRNHVATPTSATEFAMMSTTTLVATGTTVIAAARRKSTKSRIVPSASAKIAKLSSNSARKKTANVGRLTGKETRDVTTKTITADAIGMAATAVAKRTATSIAKSASVWIRKIKNALDCVDHLIGPMTVSVTTTTTTVVVDGIRETAVAIPSMRTSSSSVKNASVWIPTANTMHRKLKDAAARARTRTGRATVFATLATTTAPVSTTKAIAVAIRATRSSSNSAKLCSANAQTPSLQRQNPSFVSMLYHSSFHRHILFVVSV